MSLMDRLRGGTLDANPLDAMLEEEKQNNAWLKESIADLELAMDDRGWTRLALTGQVEFTRDGLQRMSGLCRLMAIKNPLIKRGLNLRAYYVWGSGVSISARSAGPDRDNTAAQDVNAVVQTFLDDDGNRVALTGEQAREENERALGTDGNVFLALFTNPLTGQVQVRVLPFEHMNDTISNPEDASEPWFYKRTWTSTVIDQRTLVPSLVTRTAYYPALGYRPSPRPVRVGGDPVLWSSPVIHVRVNGQRGWAYGIPDAYAAIDWARAYKEFLEDWAKLVKALSRFAWRTTTPGNKTRRRAIAATLAESPVVNPAGEPNDVGAHAVMNGGASLEAIPKSGATIDSESGRPLAGMVAAALDVPVTMLLADPGITGARATAETLDRPTELMAGARRAVWADVKRRILNYVIDEAVRAPRGPLKGTVTRDPFTKREIITLDGDTDRTVDITWPPLDEVDIEKAMRALSLADTMEVIPPLVMARLVLELLQVEDVDEILEELTDDDGNFVSPSASAGDAAIKAFRDGKDPVKALAGEEPPVDDVD